MTRGTLRKVMGWVWSTVKMLFAVVLVFSMFTCAAAVSHYQRDLRAKPCIEMGGHYIDSSITTHAECWSEDGTRRLFPKE